MRPTFWPAELAARYPVLVFVVLAFAITWAGWFSVPSIAGSDWALGKIVTGAAFGPALAAILMDRWRGTGAVIGNRRWWRWFLPLFVFVAAINGSILLTGDGIDAAAFAQAQPPGLTPVGIASALLTATVVAFIIASVAGSRSSRLASLLQWRVPWRWWLVAGLAPAAWMLLGWAIAAATDAAIESVDGGLPPHIWLLFVLRSVVFTFLVVAIGEEAGWRGWMLPELQRRMSPLTSTVVLGVIWGLWHYPLFVNGQFAGPPILVFAKVGVCVFLGVLFTWIYNRSGGNLLLAVVLHTALNNSARVIPITEQAGIGMLALILAVLIFERMWRRRSAPALRDPEAPSAAPISTAALRSH